VSSVKLKEAGSLSLDVSFDVIHWKADVLLTVPPFNIKAVLAALSFWKVMSAVLPFLLKVEIAPQKRKKSLTLSSEVSGESPAT
jgi:hypothetical protein